MVYSNGQFEDEEHHKKFHKRFVEGAQFAVSGSFPQQYCSVSHSIYGLILIIMQGWKYERIVGWYDEGRIIIVLPTDSRQHLKKVSLVIVGSYQPYYIQVDEILNLVNHELGIEHDQFYNDISKVGVYVCHVCDLNHDQ